MAHIDKIAAGIAFLLCGGLTSLCLAAALKGKQTEKWLKRSAKIVESRVKAQMDSERNTSYSPVIRFEYEFNEVKYAGKEIYFKSSPVFPTEEEAKAFLAKYPVGSTVEIRVNPNAPSKSVLIAGSLPKIDFLIFAGLIVMAVFAAIYLSL
jgi:hypothetical protein